MKWVIAVVAVPVMLGTTPVRSVAQHIKLSASLAALEKAAHKDSNDAAAHYNVALAYWNAKRFPMLWTP